MVKCWLMANEIADKSEECHRAIRQFIAIDELKKLGVTYLNIPVENYKEKLEKFAKSRNYNYMDEVKLNPSTNNYEQLLITFFEEHLHRDEEIRYVVDGAGYFDVRDDGDEWIRILCEPSDLIILPAGIYHRFTVTKNEFVHAIRLFQGEPSWIPYNRSEEADKMVERIQYISSLIS